MLPWISALVREAGKICLDGRRRLTASSIHTKSTARDLVTDTDRAVERFLRSAIAERFPDHGFFGEEYGQQNTASEYRWIIDPIDGTNSFIHDQPFFSISVALEHAGELEYGVIYAPVLGELFRIHRGHGAWLGNRKLHVSACAEMNAAMLSTGFACLRAGCAHNNLPYFNTLAKESFDVRRCGSAALDLAFVAAGRYDAFWEMSLNLYDVAAGVLLVREAGGVVTDFFGKDSWPQQGIAASNGLLHSRLIEVLSR